jgi:hypothetical protein
MRRKSKTNRSGSRGRVILNPNSNRRLPLGRVTRSPSYLRRLEDRRTFHPDTYRPIASTRQGHRLIVRDKVYSKQKTNRVIPSHTKATIAFAQPKRVALCIRRQQRKEVLHAIRKAGKTGQKRPRRNESSTISCK